MLASHAGWVTPLVWGPQGMEEVPPQIVAHGLRPPDRTPQQVLAAIQGGLPTHFSQWSAVLALGRTEQTPQIGHRTLPGLPTLEIQHQPALDVGHIRGPSSDGPDVLVLWTRSVFYGGHYSCRFPKP